VARQLGHSNIAMVAQVYGRFAPRSDERDRWERFAALQDQKTSGMGTVVGTALGGDKTQPAMPHRVTDSTSNTFIIRR
jgi:hypothetical protein